MTEAVVTIINETGMHARPASLFVRKASNFKSNINIEKEGNCINGKSILGILTLGANKGTEIKITANGEDEEEAVKQLAEFVKNGLGE